MRLTDGDKEIIMATKQGMSIRYHENDVRSVGRNATGVKGITLNTDDEVIGMDVIGEDAEVLVVTSRGYGKKTKADDYRSQSRGGKGIKTVNVTAKNGPVIGLKMVRSDNDLMIITNAGVAIRIRVKDISTLGRNTQGVRLINVREGEEVATVALAAQTEEDKEDTSEES